MSEALEMAQQVHGAVRAYMQFRDEVGSLMLALVDRGDPTGPVLLEMVKDLEARLGEFVTSEETDR